MTNIINKTYIHFSWSGNYNIQPLINAVVKKIVDTVVIFGPQEHTGIPHDEHYATSIKFDKFMKKHKIKVIRIVGAPIGKKWNPSYLMTTKKNVYSWDTFFAHAVVNHAYSNIPQPLLPLSHTKITKHFISLNRRAHPHRCLFIDLLHKHQLQNNGMVSWHAVDDLSTPYEFKYWEPSRLILDVINEADIDLNLYTPPSQFQETLFSVVCESAENIIFLTEKTFLPIFHKRPFIIFGGKHSNAYLKKLNFKLFDEVIDYSFDRIDDTTKRFDQGLLELKKICSMDPDEVLKLLQPKIEYNYRNLLNITRNSEKYVNPAIFEIVNYGIPEMDYYKEILNYEKFDNL